MSEQSLRQVLRTPGSQTGYGQHRLVLLALADAADDDGVIDRTPFAHVCRWVGLDPASGDAAAETVGRSIDHLVSNGRLAADMTHDGAEVWRIVL